MRSSVLIYNPRAGRWRTARRVAALTAVLREGGWQAEPVPTTQPSDATRLAREAAAQGAEAVFAFGGDGTLREAAAGLLASETALGPLPGGTANVVARGLGLPGRALAAAQLLAGAEPVGIDVGLCGGEPFLMQASAGLDARVVARVRPLSKRLLGTSAFAGRAFWEWWSYPNPAIAGRADGTPFTASFAAVCNLAQYGGRWKIAPRASVRDGLLDLVLFTGGRRATLGFALDLLLGRHTERPDVELRQVREVEILAPHDLPLQLDGDPLAAHPPVTIRLASEKLRILLPPGPGT